MNQPSAQQTVAGLDEDVAKHRTPAYDISPLFVNRWSPRAMTGEPLAEETYMPLFEAARWAPSAFNNQHWRFVYAAREDEEWEDFLALLSDGNRSWASDAAVLAIILSKTTLEHNGEDASTHSFDTGAAWQNLALEGTRRGLAVHPMAGFDHAAAAELLTLSAEFEVEAMVAIGERAPPETLPEELQERGAPSDRKDLAVITHRGSFE